MTKGPRGGAFSKGLYRGFAATAAAGTAAAGAASALDSAPLAWLVLRLPLVQLAWLLPLAGRAWRAGRRREAAGWLASAALGWLLHWCTVGALLRA